MAQRVCDRKELQRGCIHQNSRLTAVLTIPGYQGWRIHEKLGIVDKLAMAARYFDFLRIDSIITSFNLVTSFILS